ncbi:MAG: acetolactate synthase small subunit [Actinobacteria bacterium]|nr:acetolactate synthase small subunit [Actinomycetota bacterium]|tara:strand:+ start:548 stop:1060 length:513 start_codon:yes stop_codon:yes gene_type:complete
MSNQSISREGSHTISLFVANKPGVLLRICLVFSRRGFNIESLVVSPAIDGRFSRMTVTAQGDKEVLEQIIKQCGKLVDVVHASEHDSSHAIEQEFALIKVKLSPKDRSEILQLVQHVQGESIDFSDNTLILKIVGESKKIDTCINMLEPFGILEMVRSGKMVITKGKEET